MTESTNLHKKALLFEYLTIAWNILEGIVSMAIGFVAGSVSLFAYGLESSVEVFASSVTVWQLKGQAKGREKKALKMIGAAYLTAAAYIFIDAIQSLLEGHRSDSTFVGILFLLLTVIIMLVLGFLKRGVGMKMKNPVVLAGAKFTLIDAALSGAVLLGLVMNAFLGWWWTDPALALFLSGVAFKEGVQDFF